MSGGASERVSKAGRGERHDRWSQARRVSPGGPQGGHGRAQQRHAGKEDRRRVGGNAEEWAGGTLYAALLGVGGSREEEDRRAAGMFAGKREGRGLSRAAVEGGELIVGACQNYGWGRGGGGGGRGSGHHTFPAPLSTYSRVDGSFSRSCPNSGVICVKSFRGVSCAGGGVG